VSERTGGLRALLSAPSLYSGFQALVGASRSRRLLADRHIRPTPAARVLDIGCGPGEMAAVVAPVDDYLGIDFNERYVDAARRARGDRGRFLHADIRDVEMPGEDVFDIVLAVGILHHLDDAGACRLMSFAADKLASDGRLVTFDGVFVPGQPRIARWLIERDRGAQVRTVDEYRGLASQYFDDVRTTVSEDFLRVPYTHLVVEAAQPRRAAQ
jgi:SAM-dependent methyltransferase